MLSANLGLGERHSKKLMYRFQDYGSGVCNCSSYKYFTTLALSEAGSNDWNESETGLYLHKAIRCAYVNSTSCMYHELVCCPGLTLSLAPPPPSKKDRPPVMPKTQSKHDLTVTDHQTDSTAGENGVCSGWGQGVCWAGGMLTTSSHK